MVGRSGQGPDYNQSYSFHLIFHREELQKCRTSIEALTLERDHVMIQLDICQREGHSANMYRLESKLGKLAKELEAEGVLEAQIVDRLDIAE